MERPIRILYIEDNLLDRELVRDALEKEHGGFHITMAATRAEFETHLASGEFDAVLSDFNILGFEGLHVLDAVGEKWPRVPVIIITGTGSEEIAVEAIKHGVSDYVIKSPSHIQRLPQTIHAALDKQHLFEARERADEALRRSNERFHASVENQLDGFAILSAVRDRDGQIIDFRYEYINESGCKMNRKNREEHIGRTLLELFPERREMGLFDDYVRVVKTGQPLAKEYVTYEPVYGGGNPLKQAFDVRISRLEDRIVVTWQDITDKKKGEQLLRQSEERLKRLIENSKDIIVMADLEGSVLYYSGAPEYGGRSEDLLGKNAYNIFEPAIAARLMNQLGRVVRRKEVSTIENFIPWKGESFWFSTQMYPIRDEKDRMIAVGVIARNITERKQAEEAVRESLNRWQTTFDGIKDSIFLLDKEGVISQINKNAAKLFGKTEKEIQGHHCWEIVHGTSEPIAGCPIVRMKQSKQREAMLLPVDDKWYEVTVDPLLNQDGNLLGAVHIISDITERKRVEEKLLESEERYRSLFDGVPIGLYRTSPDGRIMDANLALVQMLGYPDRESLQATKVVGTYVNPEERQSWQALIGKKGIVSNFEKQSRRYDGSKIWVEENTRAVYDPEGQMLFYEGSFQDITERKRAEEEQERLFKQVRAGREQLQAISRRLVEVQETERRNLVRKLHDEVGQNMTALSINMNIINSQLSGDSLIKIGSRLNDSLKLIEETVERIRVVMAELRPPVLDDYGLMAALNWYGKQFSERTGIATIVEGEELKPRLPLTTETALFRITQEALTNVIKHAQAKQVTISLKSKTEKLLLTIADDGIGFEQQQQQWGLINMRERAQAVGGTLIIESAPGKGTKVTVEIPKNY